MTKCICKILAGGSTMSSQICIDLKYHLTQVKISYKMHLKNNYIKSNLHRKYFISTGFHRTMYFIRKLPGQVWSTTSSQICIDLKYHLTQV